MYWKKLIFGILATVSTYSYSAKLYVFVPTEVRANVMQETMTTACENVEVTVFGRAKEFGLEMQNTPPSAVLTVLPVIERNSEYATVMKGTKDGKHVEDFVMVTVDNPIDLATLEGRKVGVIDVLGRKPMSEFVGQLLQAKVKLKRVSKIEDLLPLLSFGAVDSVFIPESIYERIKSKSNLDLVATRLNVKVGLASAAMNTNESRADVIQCIKDLPLNVNQEMGVDQWEQL